MNEVQRLRIAVAGLLVAVVMLSAMHAWDRWRSATLNAEIRRLAMARDNAAADGDILAAQLHMERVYALWLEQRLSRHEVGTHETWREAARKQAGAVPSERKGARETP